MSGFRGHENRSCLSGIYIVCARSIAVHHGSRSELVRGKSMVDRLWGVEVGGLMPTICSVDRVIHSYGRSSSLPMSSQSARLETRSMKGYRRECPILRKSWISDLRYVNRGKRGTDEMKLAFGVIKHGTDEAEGLAYKITRQKSVSVAQLRL